MFMRIWQGNVHKCSENNEKQCQKHINLPKNYIKFFFFKYLILFKLEMWPKHVGKFAHIYKNNICVTNSFYFTKSHKMSINVVYLLVLQITRPYWVICNREASWYHAVCRCLLKFNVASAFCLGYCCFFSFSFFFFFFFGLLWSFLFKALICLLCVCRIDVCVVGMGSSGHSLLFPRLCDSGLDRWPAPPFLQVHVQALPCRQKDRGCCGDRGGHDPQRYGDDDGWQVSTEGRSRRDRHTGTLPGWNQQHNRHHGNSTQLQQHDRLHGRCQGPGREP